MGTRPPMTDPPPRCCAPAAPRSPRCTRATGQQATPLVYLAVIGWSWAVGSCGRWASAGSWVMIADMITSCPPGHPTTQVDGLAPP